MRKSGVLMHITSLPSPYGIGTFGAEAKRFIDFLKEGKQSYWQVLPLTTTGYGDSPYQSFSSFAGNPYFIDLDILNEWGLLEKEDYQNINWGDDDERTDYGKIFNNRFKVLRIASDKVLSENSEEFQTFCRNNGFWLNDYSEFMAIKNANSGASWLTWEDSLRRREYNAMEKARAELKEEIDFYKAQQYLFYKQWGEVKAYAHKNNVSIIGDIPIYVSLDSSDVWVEPQWFQLDEDLKPTDVAGCPPDAFTADGQLWGNPLYKWQNLRNNGYSWWVKRIAHQFEIYDVLRVDHFRGFEAYYAIPYGNENAKIGEWRQGPNMEIFDTINYALGKRNYIAEDLGFLTQGVIDLLRNSTFPGMKVLQFAFDSREESDYLPHNFVQNSVAYTGTHDNDTILGWEQTAPAEDVAYSKKYMNVHEGEKLNFAMMAELLKSVSNLAVLTMQDLMSLGTPARMNTPGKADGNWQWRIKADAKYEEVLPWLAETTKMFGRM